MTTLMGDMMTWTTLSEAALNKCQTDKDSMTNYINRLNAELSDIVKLVRGDLNELDRMTLGSMIVLDVHNRDVIDKLVKDNIKSIFEFPWLS
jgi:dynein heavy chain